jgi:uncharacterized membrane protein HdeD (DUF308 family)
MRNGQGISENVEMNNSARMGSRTLMLTGIVLSILGLLLLASPMAAGEFVIMMVAAILFLTGVAQVIQSFRSPGAADRLISAVLGVVVAGLGFMVWRNPEIGSGFLMTLLMVFFVVNGLWKVTTAWRFRGASGWIWLMLAGLVSLFFVWLLWSQWPVAGAWVIGVLIGIDLLLTGISMVVLAVTARRVRSSGYVDTINL